MGIPVLVDHDDANEKGDRRWWWRWRWRASSALWSSNRVAQFVAGASPHHRHPHPHPHPQQPQQQQQPQPQPQPRGGRQGRGGRRPWSCRLCVVAFVGLLVTVWVVDRFISNVESHRVFVHAPIHTMPRDCPKPSYPTLGQQQPRQQIQQQQQQQQSTTTTSNPTNPKICLTTLTDEQERSRLQWLIRWRNFDGLLQMTWKNKADYALKYGYHLFDESSHLDPSRPPSWSKIIAAKRLLTEEDCDWVWWVDADTVLMNSKKRIEDFLPTSEASQDLVLSKDHRGDFNAGGWLIRKSPYALQFLDDWWNMRSFVKPPGLATSGDNAAFQTLLRDLPDLEQHVVVPPQCTFNSFAKFLEPQLWAKMEREGTIKDQVWYREDAAAEAFFHKGDLLAHVAGYNNKGLPLQMLSDLAE